MAKTYQVKVALTPAAYTLLRLIAATRNQSMSEFAKNVLVNAISAVAKKEGLTELRTVKDLLQKAREKIPNGKTQAEPVSAREASEPTQDSGPGTD